MMGWQRPRNMRALDSGGGSGGGGGAFAPSPGFPPRGPRPPGAVPSSSAPGRGRKPFTIPRLPKRKPNYFDPWPVRGTKMLQRLLELAKKRQWMVPDSPVGYPWHIYENGWTRCPLPFWTVLNGCGAEPQPELWDWGGTGAFNSNCANTPDGQCPKNQVAAYDDPLNTTVGWPTNVTRVKFVRNSPAIPGRKDFIRTYVRPSVAGQTGPYPQFRRGYLALPDMWAAVEPIAKPQTEVWYGEKTGTALALRPGEKPAVEYAPGAPGVPVVHPPAPSPGPDKEKKTPPIPYGWPGKAYGALTEFNDMLDCMAEAMGMKPPKGPLQKRAKQVWDALGDPNKPFDPAAFAQCMALANAQDAIIGRLSNKTAKNFNRSPYSPKRPGGYQGGGWATRMR